MTRTFASSNRAKSRSPRTVGVGVGVASIVGGGARIVVGIVVVGIGDVGIGGASIVVGVVGGVVVLGVASIVVSVSDAAAARRRRRELVGSDVLKTRSFRGLFSVLMRRASGRGGRVAEGGLRSGAAWRVMRVISGLMPRAAGTRWLAEADSFLFEVPPAQRRGALRNYLLTAPQVIVVSWAGHLAQRFRVGGSSPAGRRGNAEDDPRG